MFAALHRLALPLALCGLLHADAAGAAYTFTNIVNTSVGGFRSVGQGYALNDAGEVAFTVQQHALGTWVMRGDGSLPGNGGGVLIDNGLGALASVPTVRGLANDGSVLFRVAGGSTHLVVDDGVADPRRLADSAGPVYQALVDAAISDGGRTAWSGTLDGSGLAGVFAPGGAGDLAVATAGAFFGNVFGALAINDADSIAFVATLASGTPGVFVAGRDAGGGFGDLRTVALAGAAFADFGGSVSIDNGGRLAFRALAATGDVGLYLDDGGTVAAIVDTAGGFADLRAVSLNDHGGLAFLADLDAGGSGLYTSADLLDPVVAVGDELFGSTVRRLQFDGGGNGFNDAGQLAFWYELADGRRGIARADPGAVPEPVAPALLGLALAALGLTRRRLAPRPPEAPPRAP